MVAATVAVFVLEGTQALFIVFDLVFVNENVLVAKRRSGEARALDVDVPASQTRCEAGVLTLLADGEES